MSINIYNFIDETVESVLQYHDHFHKILKKKYSNLQLDCYKMMEKLSILQAIHLKKG